jgi:hypothetical protein
LADAEGAVKGDLRDVVVELGEVAKEGVVVHRWGRGCGEGSNIRVESAGLGGESSVTADEALCLRESSSL